MRTLATMTGEYHAMMLLTFFTIYIMGLEEAKGRGQVDSKEKSVLEERIGRIPPQHVAPLLRVLSSLHKAYVCENTIPALYGCMEALGGVGYLVNSESEHLNIARIFRDACVLAIWEGTTDVLSSDTLRALKHPAVGKASLDALDWFVSTAGGVVEGGEMVVREWEGLKGRLEGGDQMELLAEARSITFRIAEILMALLLMLDVKGDGGVERVVVVKRFLGKRGFMGGDVKAGVKEGLDIDTAIVYGPGGPQGPKAEPKL